MYQDLSRLGTRIDPPRARGDEPQQIDVQVVVSRRSGTLGGIDERREAPDVAERSGERRLLDPDDAGPLELCERQLLDLAQQRLDDIRSSELDREPGGSEQAPAAASELAELGRSP